MEEETTSSKLVKKAKKLKIREEPTEEEEEESEVRNEELVNLKAAIPKVYQCLQTTMFSTMTASSGTKETRSTASAGGSGVKTVPNNIVLYSDISCDQTTLICGLANNEIRELKYEDLGSSHTNTLKRKHTGLSHICCSKASPSTFFSSSEIDGSIWQWDLRISNGNKPVQKFSMNTEGGNCKNKSILTFDIDMNDRLICGGTELVEEDCYLLFWDTRCPAATSSGSSTCQILGAYSESHSDDITAIKFHPERRNMLISGSTDGLLNIFNLLESTEDDALTYSFNTETSVDSVTWRSSTDAEQNSDHVIALTHTNEMQIWDAESGDIVAVFSRDKVAKALLVNNSDNVHLTGCHRVPFCPLKLLLSSMEKGSAKVLELNEYNKLYQSSAFVDQTSIIQTANYLCKSDRWITFDEDGYVKVWSDLSYAAPSTSSLDEETHGRIIKQTKGKRGRYKPYSEQRNK